MDLRLRSKEVAAGFFWETLRAEVVLALCFVAPRSQIQADMLTRLSAHKAKNPLSGVQNFLTSC